MAKKVKISVNELFDPDVEFVSLVSSGANRTPFKLLKADKSEDKSMFQKLNGVFKKSFKPVVAQIWVDKSTKDLDAAKARILAAGFSIEKEEILEEQNAICFEQVAAEELPKGQGVEVIAVKMQDDDDLSVIVVTDKVFQPNYDTTDFNEAVSSRLYPGLEQACDAFKTVIVNGVWQSESHDEAVAKADKALSDFSSFISDMVSAIPMEAFKFDDASEETIRKQEWLLSHVEGRETAKEDAKVDTTKTTDGEDAVKDAAKAEDNTVTEGETADLPNLKAVVAEALEASLAPLRDALKGITERMDSVEKSAKENGEKTDRIAQHIPLANVLRVDDDYSHIAEKSNGGSVPYLDTGYFDDRTQKGQ